MMVIILTHLCVTPPQWVQMLCKSERTFVFKWALATTLIIPYSTYLKVALMLFCRNIKTWLYYTCGTLAGTCDMPHLFMRSVKTACLEAWYLYLCPDLPGLVRLSRILSVFLDDTLSLIRSSLSFSKIRHKILSHDFHLLLCPFHS